MKLIFMISLDYAKNQVFPDDEARTR